MLRREHPFGYLDTEQLLEDGSQILIGFGADHARCDAGDLDLVQRQLDEILPGYVATDAVAHDWLSDEFARGTWAIHRPGWYSAASTRRCAAPKAACCSPAQTSRTGGPASSTARSSPGCRPGVRRAAHRADATTAQLARRA